MSQCLTSLLGVSLLARIAGANAAVALRPHVRAARDTQGFGGAKKLFGDKDLLTNWTAVVYAWTRCERNLLFTFADQKRDGL